MYKPFPWQKCIPHFYSPKYLLRFKHKPDRFDWTISICKKKTLRIEKSIFMLNISFICFGMPQKNPACVFWMDSSFWNTCSISLDIILIQRKERKKKENVPFDFFYETFFMKQTVASNWLYSVLARHLRLSARKIYGHATWL